MLRRGQALEAALDGAARELDQANDRALAHALAAEVLRRLPDLDALIDSATARPLPDDAKARFALRIALAQALALGTPPHAAISTVLPLVDGGPRKLVHGVFGTLMRGHARLPDTPALPEAVAARWAKTWGESMVAQAARAIAAPPPIDLTLRKPADTGTWAERLGAASLMPGHLRLGESAAIPELPGYDEGAWWVQDIAASLPARLIGTGAGHAIDVCAAPGGKTLQLASAGWCVTAVDKSDKRLDRLRENLSRTGLSAKIWIADALAWEPAEPFDAILLDAPCTASGTCRRHPDVLHRIGPRQIAEMAELQARLLERAQRWLKPGGTLVYAVCSLEREEGEAPVAKVSLPRLPIAADELVPGLQPTSEGCLRTDPGMLAESGGLDGFFMARWRAP